MPEICPGVPYCFIYNVLHASGESMGVARRAVSCLGFSVYGLVLLYVLCLVVTSNN